MEQLTAIRAIFIVKNNHCILGISTCLCWSPVTAG